MRMNHIICGADIVYENGANVRTAFVTNLGDGETVLQTAPDLGKAVNDAVEKIRKETVKQVPKYVYPWHIVTAALLQRYSKYGVELKIGKSECVRVSKMDAQKDTGKAIFGGGLLLSDEAAARHEQAAKAAAERAAAKKWELSARELAIVASMGEENAQQMENGIMNVLYLCDGARCSGCNREFCRHTTDLAHALHYDAEPGRETLEAKFERYGDYWFERD